jgi:hypothetical protein
MTKQTEALEMAIEALENIDNWLPTIGQRGLRDYEADALDACKKALEQPTQEPVIDAVDTVVTYGKYEVDETQEPIVDAVESLNQD